jgi:hypothetical protein
MTSVQSGIDAKHFKLVKIYPAHRKFPSEDMPRQPQLSDSLGRRLYRIAHVRRNLRFEASHSRSESR